MNTKREVVISRFSIGGRGFYFHTIWQGEEFYLTLTDGKYAWQGHGNPAFPCYNSYIPAQRDYIENTLKPKGMTIAAYLALTKEALTKQDTEKKKFAYSLQQGAPESCFGNLLTFNR